MEVTSTFGQNHGQEQHKIHISCLCPPGLDHLTVNSIIDNETNSWRQIILDQFFNDEDALKIQSIPLLNIACADQLWKYSPIGLYIVRTTYHCIITSIVQNDHLKEKRSWMQIWRLHIFLQKSFSMEATLRVFANKMSLANKRNFMS